MNGVVRGQLCGDSCPLPFLYPSQGSNSGHIRLVQRSGAQEMIAQHPKEKNSVDSGRSVTGQSLLWRPGAGGRGRHPGAPGLQTGSFTGPLLLLLQWKRKDVSLESGYPRLFLPETQGEGGVEHHTVFTAGLPQPLRQIQLLTSLVSRYASP